MYAPTKEQAEQDRAKAYALGVPHGTHAVHPSLHCTSMGEQVHAHEARVGAHTSWCAAALVYCTGYKAPGTQDDEGDKITLSVVSDLHDATEYGTEVRDT